MNYKDSYKAIDAAVILAILAVSYGGLILVSPEGRIIWRDATSDFLGENAGIIATVATAAAGFTLASASIIIGFLSTTRLQRIPSQTKRQLIELYFHAVAFSALAAIGTVAINSLPASITLWSLPVYAGIVAIAALRCTLAILVFRDASLLAVAPTHEGTDQVGR